MFRPPGLRPEVAAAALTPKEVLGILRRHILLMVCMTIFGFVVGGAAWYLLLQYWPRYTAETYLKVLPPVETDPMEIVAALANKDISYGHRLTIASLITQQRTLEELLKKDKIKRTKWYKRFGKLRYRSVPRAYKDLKKHLHAYALRDAEFVKVSMTCGDKDEAADIVNILVDMFLFSHGGSTREDVAKRLAQYNKRRESVRNDLDAAEESLAAIRRNQGYIDFDVRGFRDPLSAKLENLEIEQNTLLLEMGQLQATITTFEKLAIGPVTEQVERALESDPVMILLAQQLALQESTLQGLRTRFGEDHKIVRERHDLINEIREERRLRKADIARQLRQGNIQAAQDALVVTQKRYEQLEKLRQDAGAQKREFDLVRAEYEKVVARRDERREMLDSIKEAIEKLSVIYDDPRTPKVQKVGDALPPLRVSSPMWYLYFPGGTVLGFVFGVGLTFLIELLNDLVRTPRDVGRYLHIPLLGVVPHATEDGQVRDVDLCHVVRKAPYSIISESYRRLRTNLKLSSPAEALKSLLVCSGMPGDGRTTVVVNLATTFVAENKKVLLIDANFWRPSLHTALPKTGDESHVAEPQGYGLSNTLTGQCSQQEVIRPSGIEGLDIIDSGPVPSYPAELLGGMQMEQLIRQQRENYDYVIVDSPPVLLVSASKMLARVVDGTLLVFNACSTRRGAAQRTIRELKQIDANIVGCVLFAVQAMKGGYFREQFKSYRKYQKLQLAHSV
jgi:capsular exopolysaccharide synthesis family protein